MIAVGLILCASAAFATSVTVNVTGITDHLASPIAAGAFVQVIESANAGAGAPDANGLPQGDTVALPTGVTISGGFSGIRNITAGNYVYIRVWENWDGAGTPPVGAYYGTSAPENVGITFIMPGGYTPAAFSTSSQFGVTTLNITTTSLAGGTQGVAYSRSVAATGGTAPYTWSISAGSLPAGLSLNTSSGLISGTPTGTGTSNFTVRCADSGTQTDTQALSINIAAPPAGLNIATTSLPNGTVGQAYSQNVQATGGTQPYTWSLASGSLPAGLSLSTAGVISGTPTGAESQTFTVQVDDSAAASDTQSLSITITTGGGGGGITVTPSNAYIGQTIVITGSGFGAAPGTITVGGVAANPTDWSDTSVTCAVPSGATSGNVVIGADSGAITIATGGVIIDDFEGGSVGHYGGTPLADSGYYTYGTGITPDTNSINADGPQASASSHGTRGMNILYSYASDWGGGWGAAVSNTLDISAYAADTLTFYINWDGSSNIIKLSLKDANDVIYAATVSNTSLNQTGYHAIQVSGASFTWDVDDPANVAGTLDWSQIVSYNFSYPSQGTNANYQNIDSFYAGTVVFTDGPIVPTLEGEVIIIQIDPNAGPAGAKFTGIGSGFGNSQGQSVLIFENDETNTSYQCDILSWSDTSIEAIVPRLAPAGDYTLKVIRIAIAQGTIQAYESNPAAFRVTAGSSSTGNAAIRPNPFNPRSADPTHNTATIGYSTNATVIGIYIYDSTARLAYHQTTSDQVSTTWDGRDMNGNHVADGLYILRVVNEENKGLIAKGKILVIKQ